MPRQRHDNSNNWNSCISWFTDTMGSSFYHFTNEVIKVKEEEMKLKELMAQKRWNITSFAKALHKSRCTVWNWCNGHYLPNVTDIKAMAELLEVPVEEVVNCFV